MSIMPHGFNKNRVQYFKVKPARQDYKGVRYFAFDSMAEKVIQIVINQGEIKKGRAHVFGIGQISRVTFLCDYLTIGYVDSCTKTEFTKKFNWIVKLLKP